MTVRDMPLMALLLALPAGCGGESPVFVSDGGPDCCAETDDDSAWAPWPPRPGDAGLRLTWSVEARPPTVAACEEIDLSLVRLELVHQLVDFERWTAPELERPCPTGELGLEPAGGLAPGRYRFRVILSRADGTPLQHEPGGVTELIAGETTLIGHVDISAANPGASGVNERRPPAPARALLR